MIQKTSFSGRYITKLFSLRSLLPFLAGVFSIFRGTFEAVFAVYPIIGSSAKDSGIILANSAIITFGQLGSYLTRICKFCADPRVNKKRKGGKKVV